MEIPINSNSSGMRQKMFLDSETILKFFLGTDDKIDTLIKCKGTEIEMLTYDYNLYEALGSLKPYDEFKMNRLIKFLEVVDIISYRKNRNADKPILRDERVEALRAIALNKDKIQNSAKDDNKDSN